MGGIGFGIGISSQGWKSKSGGGGSAEFIISVKTDNAGTSATNQFTIPTKSGLTYNYSYVTSDGNSASGLTGNTTITFPSGAGTYDIEITGDFPSYFQGSVGDKQKVTDIKAWGDIVWQSMESALNGCTNLIGTFSDTPDLSSVTSMYKMFRDCSLFNQPLNSWDVSNVNDMDEVFLNCTSFNQPLNSWNVSSVTGMNKMFQGCGIFNQPLNSWDVSNVTDMMNIFVNCASFDQDISSWQVTQVTNFTNFMFGVTLSTANYDALLIGWDAQGAMSYSGTVDFGSSQYTSGGVAEAARTSLISKWGAIIDGGAA